MDIEHAKQLLISVNYPDYTFIAETDGRGEMYLRASYLEPDILTPNGPAVTQLTRRWFIHPNMTKSELIQTAFKCIMTSMEHRVREHFLYNGRRVFGPHFNIDELWIVAGYAEDKRE
jgi:hypothetical protein